MRGVGRAKMPRVSQVATRSRARNVVLVAVWPLRTHRLLADETLRQALVEPIIRNIAAGSIATVVHHRRGAE